MSKRSKADIEADIAKLNAEMAEEADIRDTAQGESSKAKARGSAPVAKMQDDIARASEDSIAALSERIEALNAKLDGREPEVRPGEEPKKPRGFLDRLFGED